VKQKSAHELLRGNSHGPVLVAARIVPLQRIVEGDHLAPKPSIRFSNSWLLRLKVY
jgi:hypothetical protein